jgi:hypothetical protein
MMGLIVALAAIPTDYWASKAYGDGVHPNQIHVCNPVGRSVRFGTACNSAGKISVHLGGSTTLNNTSVGKGALQGTGTGTPITGSYNTAMGVDALYNNTTGSYNTAIGFNTLYYNNGNENTAIGNGAGRIEKGPSAFGTGALTGAGTGGVSYADSSNTTGLAGPIGPTGPVRHSLSNTTAIGAGAAVYQNDMVRLGNTAVSVIEGQVPFTFTSDKNQKENFQSVDGMEVLRKLRELHLTSWNYIGNNPQKIRHYGPMAQDFYAAFGKDSIGTIGTPTTINSGDMAGILMIAVQELEKQKTAQAEEIKQLISDNARLREQVNSQSKEMGDLKANIVESRAENSAFKTRLDRISQMMDIHDMTQAISE